MSRPTSMASRPPRSESVTTTISPPDAARTWSMTASILARDAASMTFAKSLT